MTNDAMLILACDAFLSLERQCFEAMDRAPEAAGELLQILATEQAPHMAIISTQRPTTWGGLVAVARLIGLQGDIDPTDPSRPTDDRICAALRSAVMAAARGREAAPL